MVRLWKVIREDDVALGHMLPQCLVLTQVISAPTIQAEFPSQSQPVSIPNKVLVLNNHFSWNSPIIA